MSQSADAAEAPRSNLVPVVRYYLFTGSIGLLVMWLAMFERGYEIFSLIPVLLGAIGLAPSLLPPRWRELRLLRRLPATMLPLMVVFLIVPMEILFIPERYQRGDFLRLSDVLLTLGLMSYLFSQYRLLGLSSNLLPVDERPRADRLGGDEPEPRPVTAAQPGEWKHLLWLVPVCVIAGQVMWQWLLNSEQWNVGDTGVGRLDVARTWWRIYVLVWILTVSGLLLTAALTILRIYRMSRTEAAASAQETIWNETRGEQRRIHRWLAWLRRKQARETGLLP